MKIRGNFKLEGEKCIFETTERRIRCTNCLKKIRSGETVYVCDIARYVYCLCHSKKNTPICKATLFSIKKEHNDILCTLKMKNE